MVRWGQRLRWEGGRLSLARRTGVGGPLFWVGPLLAPKVGRLNGSCLPISGTILGSMRSPQTVNSAGRCIRQTKQGRVLSCGQYWAARCEDRQPGETRPLLLHELPQTVTVGKIKRPSGITVNYQRIWLRGTRSSPRPLAGVHRQERRPGRGRFWTQIAISPLREGCIIALRTYCVQCAFTQPALGKLAPA